MKAIPMREFGQTGLKVTILGLGAAQVGSSQLDEKDAERLLNGVLDAGINLIDTARGYGLSEERIGKYIAHRRSEYILSTKVGYDVEGYVDWTGEAITAGIERALRLLHTDVLDIVHLHSCELADLQREGVIAALEQARQAGKIRFAAYSGENEALNYAILSHGFQSVQFSVNICDQRSIDGALIAANREQLGVIAKRPVANFFWQYAEQPVGRYSEQYWLRGRQMQLDPGGISWQEFALRFAAFTPGVHTCITGTASLGHFLENLQNIAKGPLPDATYANIRNLFKTHDQGWIGQE